MSDNIKTRILNYPWHLSHQYELLKIPDTQFTWLVQHRRNYGTNVRGDMLTKHGVEYVPHYQDGKYDAVLMHLDQQCFEDALWERGKGSLFRELDGVVQNTPKIVIMHGTPYYPEEFGNDVTEENYEALGLTKGSIGCSSELIKRFKTAVTGASAIVFNSYRGQEQWDMLNDPRATTIWHGLDAEEWEDLPKEPRVVTMISPGGLDMYYDRTFLKAVKEQLEDKNIAHCHITVDAQFKSFEEYRRFLGRSLIYFNPTRESPMPRSRTEAMFSGCCVLTTPHQDADKFIVNGENGILIPRNPEFVVNLIEGLIYDYKKALAIGQAGRKTALEKFSGERYRAEWRAVLDKVTKGVSHE